MTQNTTPEIGFDDLINQLAHRRRLIWTMTFIAFALSSVIALLMPRYYEAQSIVMVQAPESIMAADGRNLTTQAGQPPGESIVLSQVEVLRSRDIAEKAVTALKLADDKTFWSGTTPPQDPVKAKNFAVFRLVNHLKVKPIGRSLVIGISYEHTDPTMAARVVNGVTQVFQNQQIADKRAAAQKTALWLQDRLNTLAEKLHESSRAVEEYRSKENLTNGLSEPLTTEQVSDISAQIILAQADLATAQSREQELQSVLDSKQSLEGVNDVAESRFVGELKQQEALLRKEYAELQSKYGVNHPRMRTLQAELNAIQLKKREEIKTATEITHNKVVAAQARLEALQTSLQNLESERHREDKASIGLKQLEQEAKANKELYESFLARYKEVSLARDIQQPDVKIVSAARVPALPGGAPRFIIICLATFCGFFLSLVAVIILEQVDRRVRSPQHLQDIAPGVPILALVPQTRDMKEQHLADYILNHPFSAATESIRGLRLRLMQNRPERGGQVIALTSALPDEGKTTTALWLARMLAGSGSKVLFVEADLRRPVLRGILDLRQEMSVVDILQNGRTIHDIRQMDQKLSGLSLLPGQVISHSNLDRITADSIKAFYDTAKQAYDVIIIDTAPLLTAPEARLFVQEADQSLFLVRWNHTPVSIIREAASLAPALTGFVMTRINPEAGILAAQREAASYYYAA